MAIQRYGELPGRANRSDAPPAELPGRVCPFPWVATPRNVRDTRCTGYPGLPGVAHLTAATSAARMVRMTSLLSGPARTQTRAPVDARHRRPLVLLAVLGGVAAAASTLVVCLAVGVVGWFLTDAGAHGAPRDGLRAGAIAWLMGHGSGLTIAGVTITAIPLGVSVVCAWSVWRIAHRVGDSVSGHGPDADALADGARDWTVPTATLLFT